MLTITHTHKAGTIIEGTRRGDGTAPIVKDQRWRWGRSIGAWYRPNSRDHRPDHLRIRDTVAALEAAGYDVAQELDESICPTAKVESGKIARQAARVDALDAKADRKHDAVDAAWDRHMQHVAALPEGGKPIKVGHHSEGRHRNAIDRAYNSARRGIDADHAAERANAAAHTTAARYSTRTVHNHIGKINTDIRRLGRKIEADRYDPTIGYVPATDELKQRYAERAAPASGAARQLRLLGGSPSRTDRRRRRHGLSARADQQGPRGEDPRGMAERRPSEPQDREHRNRVQLDR